MPIAIARSDADIQKCFPVMHELRPAIPTEGFVERIRRLECEGFILAYLEEAGQVRAVAGYRFGECLASGTYLYVDDLVTREVDRSKGYGEKLLQWLAAQARDRSCDTFSLDSGVQRHGAHRFYLSQRMDILGYHFILKLR